MERYLKKHKYELVSVVIALLWLLVCLASRMVEETGDDIAIAFMIAHSPEHLCLYIHPAYSKLLGFFFDWIPGINWWSVFSLLGITAGIYVFSIMLLKKFAGCMKWIAAAAVLSLVYIAAIDQFHFTRTAGVVSLAGAMLVVESICDQAKGAVNRILTGISAVVLLLWGSSIRSECFLMCVPFCAGYFVSKLYLRADRVQQIRSSWKSWMKRAGVFTAILLSVFVYVESGKHWLESDPEWAEYVQYDYARSVVADFGGMPAYKDNEAAYKTIGVSETDFEMVLSWITENPDSITAEKMTALAELSDVQIDWKTAAYAVYRMRDRLVFAVAAMIVLACICLSRLDDWFYIGCISAGAAAIAVVIAMQGRFPFRIFDVICLNVAVSCLMGSRFEGYAWSQKWNERVKQRIPVCIGKMLERAFLVIVLAAACTYIVQGFSDAAWYWQRWNRPMQRIRKIEEQKDRVYVLPVGNPLAPNAYAYGLWSMPQNGAAKNIFYLGGWNVRAPYSLKIREEQGVHNPFTALVEKRNVYSTAYKPIQDLLCKYYGDHITASTVDQMDDVEIIQYSKAIRAEDMPGDEKRYDLMMSKSENNEYLQIKIDADMKDFEQYEDVRLNFSTKNGLKTFRIRQDENGFSAKLHENYEDLGESACLIGLRQEGVYEMAGNLELK